MQNQGRVLDLCFVGLGKSWLRLPESAAKSGAASESWGC